MASLGFGIDDHSEWGNAEECPRLPDYILLRGFDPAMDWPGTFARAQYFAVGIARFLHLFAVASNAHTTGLVCRRSVITRRSIVSSYVARCTGYAVYARCFHRSFARSRGYDLVWLERALGNSGDMDRGLGGRCRRPPDGDECGGRAATYFSIRPAADRYCGE